MFAFVFNPPPDPKKDTDVPLHWNTEYKSTVPKDSWWDTLARKARSEWWPGVQKEQKERLQFQRWIPEPTVRKSVPDWQRRWDAQKEQGAKSSSAVFFDHDADAQD